MGDRLLWLLFAVAMFALIVMHGYIYYTGNNEGFTDATATMDYAPNLKACPAALRRYYVSDAINCCEGAVINGKCKGKAACTLSAKSGELPRCVDWLATYSITKGIGMCPISLPQYFENEKGAFCTASPVRRDLQGTVDKDAKKCAIEGNLQKRLDNPESCYNIRRLDEMKVRPDYNVKEKRLVSTQGGPRDRNIMVMMALYTVGDDTIPKSCVDKGSVEQFWDLARPNWRSDPIELERLNKMDFCS